MTEPIKKLETVVVEGDYGGHPYISIFEVNPTTGNLKEKAICSFGHKKVRAILENIETLERFDATGTIE